MFHPLNFFGDHGGSSEVYYGCKSSPFPKKLRSSSWLSMSLTHDFASDDIHNLSKTLVAVTCNAATYMIIYHSGEDFGASGFVLIASAAVLLPAAICGAVLRGLLCKGAGFDAAVCVGGHFSCSDVHFSAVLVQ
ncbi:transmembrane protein, putative [Medicago truncatula]|uniref:Transmembrane protein, putative n=1 Tax=Medicago truncatula TaxID=3880 RepID=G7JB37_MEDTR|nr:transmembrane protein, putative [Medicago truncatula]